LWVKWTQAEGLNHRSRGQRPRKNGKALFALKGQSKMAANPPILACCFRAQMQNLLIPRALPLATVARRFQRGDFHRLIIRCRATLRAHALPGRCFSGQSATEHSYRTAIYCRARYPMLCAGFSRSWPRSFWTSILNLKARLRRSRCIGRNGAALQRFSTFIKFYRV